MRWLAAEAMRVARELPHSRRHVVILVAMIGNYLSTPEAHIPELEPVSESVLETVGELKRPTMLVFKLRRLPTSLRGALARRDPDDAHSHSHPDAHPDAPPQMDKLERSDAPRLDNLG